MNNPLDMQNLPKKNSKVSIIICTYNAQDRIMPTLDSLLTLDVDADTEIIIVDNNSTDKTKEVILNFIGENNNLKARYVFEGKQGLSNARNRGIVESKGAIIVFLDDDVVPDKSWIKSLLEVYEQEDYVGCVGGEVILNLPAHGIPSWFDPSLELPLSKFTLDKNYYFECKKVNEYPIGSNFSFSREALQKCGPFDVTLGIGGTKLDTGEDTEMCARASKYGFRVFYQPKALVTHNIDKKKITKEYLKKRADTLGVKLIFYANGFKFTDTTIKHTVYYFLHFLKSLLNLLKVRISESERFKAYLRMRTCLYSVYYCIFLKYKFK